MALISTMLGVLLNRAPPVFQARMLGEVIRRATLPLGDDIPRPPC
jgi:hypothetical protein